MMKRIDWFLMAIIAAAIVASINRHSASGR